MRRRTLSLSLVFMLALSLFVTSFGVIPTDLDWIHEEVEETNLRIEEMIANAQEEAQREIEESNKKIENFERIRERSNSPVDKHIEQEKMALEQTIDIIIKDLVRDTDNLANSMIEKAASYGVTVICEYVTVEIGGHSVLIDPLRIIGE